MDINKDLQTVDNLINNREHNRWNLSNLTWIYPFTNENIKAFFSNFDFQDKKCLTILSGGNFVFDMYLKGANEITTFDVNPLTYYFFHLKKAAIQADFTLEEFKEFFLFQKRYNKKQFEYLKPYLDAESYEFWDFIFKKYDEEEIKSDKSLFHQYYKGLEPLEKFITYLSKENYNILKEKINNLKINFIEEDIRTLYQHNLDTYDFIYFSNIIEYANDLFYEKIKNNISEKTNLDYVDEYCLNLYRELMNEYKNFLNPDGYLVARMVSFIYDGPGSHLNSNKFRQKLFGKYGFKDVTFPSLDNIICYIDEEAVGITYQKKL